MAPILAARTFGSGPSLTALHGFTGNARSWGPFLDRLAQAYGVTALDLPGHGGSTTIRANLGETADLVAAASPAQTALLGYSLGGRVALHLALAHPNALRALVLIGATPGIVDDAERATRADADRALAEEIRAEGDVAAFIERWLALDLFATVPTEAQQLEARLANTAAGLAASLEDAGTGTQAPLWDRLGELEVPTLLVTGSLDAKFTAIARSMATRIVDARVAVVEGAGHATHLEQAEVVADLVADFLGEVDARVGS